LLLIFSLFILLSCGSGDEKSPKVVVQALELSPNNLTITQLDIELLLNVIATDQNSDEFTLSNGLSWESSDESLATVDAQGKITTHAPGNLKISVSYGELTDSIDVEVTESDISIQGKIFYQDKKYDNAGFTNGFIPTFNNVRYVTVDLLGVDGEVLETTQSDSNGWFQFGHIIPEYYAIRVMTAVSVEPAPGFAVKDMDGNVYAVRKDAEEGVTTYDIKVSKDSEVAGAFNILDVFVSAAEFSREALQVDIADLSVFWEINNGLGTYYCSGFDRDFCKQDRGIYVLNIPSGQFPDTDEYDDDVLLHEFGHFVMEKHFIDDSPAGCHFITTNDSDLSLAWSEGWGTFFGSAVKFWMNQTPGEKLSSIAEVTSYVDTDGIAAFLSYDIKFIDDLVIEDKVEDSFYYASSESAVSKILWSVFEAYGIEKIGDVLANHFTNTSQPTNLANFWQGLLISDLYDQGQLTNLTTIFAERQVHYKEDDFEDDDVISTANILQVGAITDHYLYKDDLSDDIDMFAFDVISGRTYSVQTSDLRNGIDTYIRILDENGNVADIPGEIMENDDANPGVYYRYDSDPSCGSTRFFNDKTSLASKVEFTAISSGRYYVEVSHLSTNINKFGAVGPYGSYRLTVK